MPTYNKTQRLHDNILSVKTAPGINFSEVQHYAFTSKGSPPSVIHSNDGVMKPDGTTLSTTSLFFQPAVQNSSNPPTFSQLAIEGLSEFSEKTISAAELVGADNQALITTSTAHGLSAGDLVDVFISDSSLTVNPNGVHTVLASGLTTTQFKYSLTGSNETYTVGTDSTASFAKLVSETKQYVQITDPGIMSAETSTSVATIGTGAGNTSSGTAVVYPKVDQAPKTYRKLSTVKSFITASSSPSPEVAYNNENIEYASASFISRYQSNSGAANVSASHKVFSGYLRPDVSSKTISAAELSSNVAIITTSTEHGFGVGDSVVIASLTGSDLTPTPNGTFEITALGAADDSDPETKFRYALVGGDTSFTTGSSPTATLSTNALTRNAQVAVSGKFSASAFSKGAGALSGTYVTTGIFRSEVDPFIKSIDGSIQYFIKTDASF